MTIDSTTPSNANLCAFALALVQSLCDTPGEASLSPAQRESDCLVTVSADDFARLSAGRGRTVRSLGTILAAAAAKLDVRCGLELRSGQ